MRRRSWTDEDLAAAVASAESYTHVVRLLREHAGTASYVAVRVRIAELGLPTDHLDAGQRRERRERDDQRRSGTRERGSVDRRTWSDEDLTRAVQAARSYAGVLRELGLRPGGEVYVNVKRRIAELGLSTEHFTGRAWNRGRSGTSTGRAYPLEQILVVNSSYTNTHRLKERLWREGLKERRCEICGLDTWQGGPAPLQLDHINGDRRDNRIENLRILCANCHAQTASWCGRNIGRYGTS